MLLLVALPAACRDTPPEERVPLLELAEDTIELRGGVALHEVRLRERGGEGEIEPARIEASRGDVLRFVASDARGYSVRFLTEGLGADAAAFLDATNQLASPPLLGEGTAWVVNLEDAPPGEYPFVSANRGVVGVVVVR